jgi:hypothetical protein
MKEFREVVELWSSDREMAKDLEIDGVNPPEVVRGWHRTNSIPPRYWRRILERPIAKQAKLTPELLMEMAEGR